MPHLRGPVQAGDHPVLGPVLIIEESAQRQAGPRAQVSGKKETKLTQWCPTEVKQLPVLTVVSLARCGQLVTTDGSIIDSLTFATIKQWAERRAGGAAIRHQGEGR